MAEDFIDTRLDLEARVAQLERERQLLADYVARPGPGLQAPIVLANGAASGTYAVDGAFQTVLPIYTGVPPAILADGGYTQCRQSVSINVSSGNAAWTGNLELGVNVAGGPTTGFGLVSFFVADPGWKNLLSGWGTIPAAIRTETRECQLMYRFNAAGGVYGVNFMFASLLVR